ncbi:hypothetical protein [Kordia zhangzhouensis]|uniref:hypothetical protein n=1 Tax=Kordia zhangzhouensis TaxID=1620405 RepID=UPI00062964AF|nr:hypothetical protein [Kordia zhangzhouensis]
MSLSRKSKIALAAVFILAILAYVAYSYAYKPHTSINDMEVAFTGNSQAFLEKIKDNADAWTKGEKVVTLTGEITAKDQKGITINESIYFQLEEGTATETFSEGQKVQVKGRIIGYDDLLEEVKLDKAVIIKK